MYYPSTSLFNQSFNLCMLGARRQIQAVVRAGQSAGEHGEDKRGKFKVTKGSSRTTCRRGGGGGITKVFLTILL